MHPAQLIPALAAIASLCVTANADIVTCVPNRPISGDDLDQAFQNMHDTNNGIVFIDGRSSAVGQSDNGQVQFYVCNKAYSRRFFTLDGDKQSSIDNALALCGGDAFFITESDDFSYGGDQAGIGECGF